ncbi:Hypothetical predicted protein [Pelobates cultripes]|uniref:Centrosomal protein of 192 kDa n=1 Tax=Pelobates cultripes TaxID=61616 RepID=A0AAD1W607_PELCU|nr:Hypothetical predicted protein [Pelobates cultripes]
MTESFSKIEDETFPSFLGESINSNISVALENCTLTSNLGLPVAASTVAKTRSGFDRLPDIQASYLGNCKLSPADNSIHFSQSDSDLKGKHVLSSKDEFCPQKTVEGGGPALQNPSNADMEHSSSKLSSDLYKYPHSKQKEPPVTADFSKEIRKPTLEDDFESVSSFLENEKLMSIASLDGSSSDELDDEEFYDDQLEAYFKKLLPPGMQRGIIEGQEIADPRRVSYTTRNSIPTRTVNQESERLQFLEDCEEHFQMLHVRLAATGMDSAPASDDDDDDEVQLELEKAAQLHLQREQFLQSTAMHLVGEQNRLSFRPGLEGGSSEDESSNQRLPSRTGVNAARQSVESNLHLNTDDKFSLGDGSSGSDDEGTALRNSVAQSTELWEADFVTRNVAGAESGKLTQILPTKQLMEDRKEPVGNGDASNESQLNHSQLDVLKQGLIEDGNLLQNSVEGKKLDSFYFENGNISSKYTHDVGVNRLSDPFFSSCQENHGCPDTPAMWKSMQEQPFSWCLGQSGNEGGGCTSQSVVYQNEDGKWVTDLAYYRSFDGEDNVKFSQTGGDLINESNFVAGSDALAMIEEDQQEFEKEHRFIQEEQMDLENTSLNMGDTSWKLPPSNVLLRTSQVNSDMCKEDASYLRLSLGEFFSQRSEALGCLGGGQDVKRPSFGYHIISPEKQEPIVLLKASDTSGNSDYETTIKFFDDTLIPEDLGCLPDDQKIACATFEVRTPEKKLEETSHRKSEHEETIASAEMLKEKSEQETEKKVLSISKIASAIADASCSADPSQLAAIIMELSHKSKTLSVTSDPENPDFSVNWLRTSLEKYAPAIIDMERYLKATEISGRESEMESFVQSMNDFTWDMSPKYKQQVLQDSVGDLTNITDVQKQDLKKPDNSHEVHTSSLQTENVGRKTETKAVCLVASVGHQSKAGGSGSNHTKLKTSMGQTSELPNAKQNFQTSDTKHLTSDKSRTEKEKGKVTKSGIQTVAPIQRKSDTLGNKVKPLRERVKEVSQVTASKQGQTESSSQLTSNIPKSTKVLRSPRRSSSRLSDPDCQQHSNNSEQICKDIHQKHVSFQTSASTKVPIKDTAFSGHDANGMEDDQYTFRPSTSPLIHSSPSQDSLKISDQSSANCSESTVSESSCLSPSLSRLTYISMAENTLQAATNPSTANKSNDTIELSTTIVRASPTPQEMQNNSNMLSWQNKRSLGSDTSPLKLRKDSSPKHYNYTQKEDVFNFQDKSKSVNVKEKIKAGGPTGTPLNYNHEPPVPVDPSFPYPRFTHKSSQALGSTNIIPASGLENYPLIQSATLNGQYVSSLKPAHQDLENMALSVQALLTGQPLSSTAFAQQYLGSMTTVGNTAPQTYQVGPSSLYGTHPGYPSCSIPASHSQNTSSGLLTALPITSHMASKPESATVAGGFPGQSFSTTGLQQWGARVSSGFGQVLVPEELTFPSACCVGIASQSSLNVFNPNDRWMQVHFAIQSIAVNGEKIDTAAYQCLVFKNKTIIGPRSGEEMKFLFLPQRSGLFQCVLSVSSFPVSADTETILRAEAMTSKVLITAVSEYPLIEVDTGKTDGLDFGDLSTGSWKALPLKLINRTHATVPIRLIISANATAWRCFTFSKDPSTLPSEYPLQVDLSKMSSPSVISQVMHATYDGQEPECILTWIVFHAPQSYSTTGPLGPAEEYVARVDVEVDSPGPACVLKSVPLRARAGCARIHAPKDLQSIHLLCNVGSSAKQLLPLKNAGNIAVHLHIKSSNPDSCFSVNPEDLFLVPGEEQIVAVTFSPQYSKLQKSVLKIMVQPSGPQYEVSVIGETESQGNRNPVNPPLLNISDVPPILSNKQFVSWGGVCLGRAVQQKLMLRNTSTNSSQHLRLLIRGQDQDCFQLQNIFGTEERLTSNRELTIRAKEDATIHLMFSPTRVGCMLARLEIKQSGIKSSLPGIKFTIPLSGYGGTSTLILDDVKKLSDSYLVTLNGVSTGRVSHVEFLMKNTGSRAAYVKAVCFSDFQKNVTANPKNFCVKPEKFVLMERSQEIITITCNATEREEMLCQSNTMLIATVCFFCGDEVARQQYRRALLHKPDTVKKIIAENPRLKSIKFDEEFPGEHLMSEVYDLPQRPNDIQLFYANMSKIILSVVGSKMNTNTSENRGQVDLRANVDSSVGSTERNIGNISLDVLPVKGPQGPPLFSSTNQPVQPSASHEQTWSVQPDYLVLTAPTISGIAGTGQIKLTNSSSRLLQFELSWPAHCLTITPQHGNVEPQSHIIILVSPNPSLATKPNLLPWNGQIYVHCDNGQKFVKVQISEESSLDKPTSGAAPKHVPILSSHPKTPVHMAKPLLKAPYAKVEVKNRMLMFPKTASGESSETFLDLENPGDEEIKWLLSSFAPPYVKGIDQSGDVYRANYTAFRCSRVSGVLAAHAKLKVAISFFPRDRGDYAQYWDLECHPVSEPHLKNKVRFQLCGEGVKDGDLSSRYSADLKTDDPVIPRKRCGSEASTLKIQEEVNRGVFAPQELYTFPPTLIGDSSTLKVNLQNNSFSTYMLKFVSPGEPFHMKHSKYSLRAHHYINLPVKFKPSSSGKFDGLLVVQADTGNICIRLVGEALLK